MDNADRVFQYLCKRFESELGDAPTENIAAACELSTWQVRRALRRLRRERRIFPYSRLPAHYIDARPIDDFHVIKRNP